MDDKLKIHKAINTTLVVKNKQSIGICVNKIHGIILDVLDEYNNFLLKNGYTDTDIISEEPTALDQFLIFNK